MKNFLKITSLIFFLFTSFANAEVVTVKWNSEEGLKRLESSKHKSDFYQLAGYFQPQINPIYCSAATSVIILNAIAGNGEAPSQKELEVAKPKVFGDGNIQFKSYSQITFFNDQTNKIKDKSIIDFKAIDPKNENDKNNFDPGLTLKQLNQILSKVHKLKVKMVYVKKADEKSINKFRKIVKEVTSDNKKYLISNFDGHDLDLKTNGHISPIVAFDEASDSILVLDVAGHKNGWYWANISDFVKAMNTKDGDKYRGYLVVSK